MECPEIKLNSSLHPPLENDDRISGSSTFRQLFHSMGQDIHASMLDIETKQAHRPNATERAMVKVMIFILIQTLLGGNSGMEVPRCLLTAMILYFDVSSVLARPSFSPTLQASSWVTSSIVTNSPGSSDTLNVTVTQPLNGSASLSATQSREYRSSIYFYQSTIKYSPVLPVKSTVTSTGNSRATPQPIVQSNAREESLLKQGACEDGWLEFGEDRHCYKLVQETRTFNHAQKICFHQGSHLVTISSKKENNIIFNLTRAFFTYAPDKHEIWIGLERLSFDSALHWVDKTPLNFHNWAPGEPDSNGACVKMIRKAWWEDTACLQQIHFICERDGLPSIPYSRALELGILIGIPLACTLIMMSVVIVLFVKSVRDSEGTHFGYGKKRNKGILHSCLVKLTASNGHSGPQAPSIELDLEPRTSSTSRHQSPVGSRRESRTGAEAPPEIRITPGTPELPERQEARVFASTSSIEQEPSRFQSTTSLDNLMSKSYFKSKGRRMRSLRKSEAVVSPAGKEGRFRKIVK